MIQDDRLAEIRATLREFVAAREWGQFHDPKNLAMALASECGELVAELRWTSSNEADDFAASRDVRRAIEEEVADVAITLLLFCDRCGIDLTEVIERKIALNVERYPVESSRGRAERPAR